MLHKLVSRKILPKDYGGEGKSLDKITSNGTIYMNCNHKMSINHIMMLLLVDWKKRVEDQREFLMEQENHKYDESKRPAGHKAKWFGFN